MGKAPPLSSTQKGFRMSVHLCACWAIPKSKKKGFSPSNYCWPNLVDVRNGIFCLQAKGTFLSRDCWREDTDSIQRSRHRLKRYSWPEIRLCAVALALGLLTIWAAKIQGWKMYLQGTGRRSLETPKAGWPLFCWVLILCSPAFPQGISGRLSVFVRIIWYNPGGSLLLWALGHSGS